MKKWRKRRPLTVFFSCIACMSVVAGCSTHAGEAMTVNGKRYSEIQIEDATREANDLMSTYFLPSHPEDMSKEGGFGQAETRKKPVINRVIAASLLATAQGINPQTVAHQPQLKPLSSVQQFRSFLVKAGEAKHLDPRVASSYSDSAINIMRAYFLTQQPQLDKTTMTRISATLHGMEHRSAPRYGIRQANGALGYNVPANVTFLQQNPVKGQAQLR